MAGLQRGGAVGGPDLEVEQDVAAVGVGRLGGQGRGGVACERAVGRGEQGGDGRRGVVRHRQVGRVGGRVAGVELLPAVRVALVGGADAQGVVGVAVAGPGLHQRGDVLVDPAVVAGAGVALGGGGGGPLAVPAGLRGPPGGGGGAAGVPDVPALGGAGPAVEVPQVELAAGDLLPADLRHRELQEGAGDLAGAVVAQLEFGLRGDVGGVALLDEGVEADADVDRRVDGDRVRGRRVVEEGGVRRERQVDGVAVLGDLQTHRGGAGVVAAALVDLGVPHHRGGQLALLLAGRRVEEGDRVVRVVAGPQAGRVQGHGDGAVGADRAAVLELQELLEAGPGGLDDQVGRGERVPVPGPGAVEDGGREGAAPGQRHAGAVAVVQRDQGDGRGLLVAGRGAGGLELRRGGGRGGTGQREAERVALGLDRTVGLLGQVHVDRPQGAVLVLEADGAGGEVQGGGAVRVDPGGGGLAAFVGHLDPAVLQPGLEVGGGDVLGLGRAEGLAGLGCGGLGGDRDGLAGRHDDDGGLGGEYDGESDGGVAQDAVAAACRGGGWHGVPGAVPGWRAGRL